MQDSEFPVTNNEILNEIIKSRNELKNLIEATETRLLLKIEEEKQKINKLTQENESLKLKVEHLERESKKKNLIVFGLNKPSEEITPEFIINEIKQLVDVEINQSEISDLYTIGRGQNRPVKIELTNNFRKSLILKNCFKLKGTHIKIANDLTLKQRQEGQILRKHLNLARLDGNNRNCFIRRNKLIVDDISYSPEELEKNETEEDAAHSKPNSAPSTPIFFNANSTNTKTADQPVPNKTNNSETSTKVPETPKIKKQTKENRPIGFQKVTRSRTGSNTTNRS